MRLPHPPSRKENRGATSEILLEPKYRFEGLKREKIGRLPMAEEGSIAEKRLKVRTRRGQTTPERDGPMARDQESRGKGGGRT